MAATRPEPLTNAIISAKILGLMQGDATVQQAIDAVLGAGTHARIAGELYDALRAAK